ncbi:hypothetical protein [Flavobacterium alkalisoli]|uniref:hypothetical protein n=1 Tax=Flavobacterium alkalisoli TaxID=2602769 RepID=UPI003A9544B0
MTNEDIVVLDTDQTTELNLLSHKDEMLDGVYDLIGDSLLGQNMRLASLQVENMTENEIRNSAKPTKTDEHLRVALWSEIELAEKEKRNVIQTNIFKGICSGEYWLKLVKEKPNKLAYIACPLRSYEVENRLIHNIGQQRMFEILSKSAVSANGKIDKGLADLQLKVYKFIDDKIKGGAVQRIQKHTTKDGETPKEIKDLDALEVEVKKLEQKVIHNG